MHGARGGAPQGKRNGNYKHGGRTKEAITSMREVNELLRLVRTLALADFFSSPCRTVARSIKVKTSLIWLVRHGNCSAGLSSLASAMAFFF